MGVAAVARAADKASEVISTATERSAENPAETLTENITAMLVRAITTAVPETQTAGVRWHSCRVRSFRAVFDRCDSTGTVGVEKCPKSAHVLYHCS